MGELNEGYTSHRGIRMALSALKMFAPYSGDAASAPGGRGNGAANRVALWLDGNTLTSSSTFTYNASTFQFVQSGANSGGNVQFQISNTVAAAASNAILRLDVANTSGGDAFIKFASNNSTVWSCGMDSSASNAFSWSNSATLGTTEIMQLTTTGNLSVTASSGSNLKLTKTGNTPTIQFVGGSSNDIFQDMSSGTWRVTNNGGTEVLQVSQAGSVVIGSGSVSTSATDGFLYITSCNGTPTGVPTAYAGRPALVYDLTNNKICVYNGAWKQTAALT